MRLEAASMLTSLDTDDKCRVRVDGVPLVPTNDRWPAGVQLTFAEAHQREPVLQVLNRAQVQIQFGNEAGQFRKRQPVQVMRPGPVPDNPLVAFVVIWQPHGIVEPAQQRERHGNAMQCAATIPVTLSTEKCTVRAARSRTPVNPERRMIFLDDHVSTRRAEEVWWMSGPIP